MACFCERIIAFLKRNIYLFSKSGFDGKIEVKLISLQDMY